MTHHQLEADLALLWGAYTYLRDSDLSALSSSSRLLQERDVGYLQRRLQQEIMELVGVLTGEHRHCGFPQDLVLESSQVCYWLYLLALSENLSFAQLQPHVHLADCAVTAQLAPLLIEELAASAWALQSTQSGELLPVLVGILDLVGNCCMLFGVDPGGLVRYDLSQMQQRPYMAAYFANSGRA